MKNNFTRFFGMLLLLAAFVTGNESKAQCGQRYHDLIFQDSTVSNITYGWNYKYNNTVDSLQMDIYLPKGDVQTDRPLVIVAHGGNFIGGSKTGTDVVPLCKNLAQMGYVTASINYRLGFTNFPFPGPDSTDATEAVMRAVHDGRAAVRYMRKAYENGNPYGIDSSMIFFGGVSAGGILAAHLAYLDQMSEYPTYIDTVNQYGLNGGIEGLSGNPGYSSKVKGIINVCGAIGDTAWMNTGDAALMSFHGDNDNTVPYGSSLIYLLGTYPLLSVDGSSSMAIRANNLGLTNCFETWEGQDHTPEVSNPAYYDSMLVITRNFLAHFSCGETLNCSYGPEVTAVNEINENISLSLYPNPSNNESVLELGNVNGTSEILMYDMTGKLLFTETTMASRYIIAKGGNPAGIYFVVVKNNNRVQTTKLIFE